MLNKVTNVALIGCGRVAVSHAKSLVSLSHTNLAAVVDIKEDRARKFSEEYGAPWFTDFEEVLKDPNIDAVQIATPHHLHAPIAIAAANAGKHVLTEKPMAITSTDANRMIQAAKDNNVSLGVVFQCRWNDISRAAKAAIEEGRIGKILGARAFITWDRSDEYYKNSDWKGTWDKEGGGVLIDQAIHTIDLGQWLIGEEIEWVKGTWETRCHDFIDVDDVAEATVCFKSGIKFSFYANNYYPLNVPIFLEVVGDKGMIHITADKGKIMTENTTLYVQQSKGIVPGMEYWGKSHCLQISDFYRDVQNGVRHEVDGHAGKVALDIVLATYKSGRTGERIDFPFED